MDFIQTARAAQASCAATAALKCTLADTAASVGRSQPQRPGRTGPSNAARPTTHCFQLVARRTVPCTSLPEPQTGH
jgi:hypothetical protein